MKKAPAGTGRGFELHRHDDLQGSTADALKSQPKFAAQARWKAAHPKAAWAHASLRSALNRGLIEREPCSECGAEPTDGHHENYDEPMRVTWLCRRHHRAAHKREAKRG